MEWVEVRGETLEAAKEEALDQLGVARDDAEFEVVQEPESRWLGFKKTEARVRARVRPTQPRPKRDARGGRRQRRGRSGQGGERAQNERASSQQGGRGSNQRSGGQGRKSGGGGGAAKSRSSKAKGSGGAKASSNAKSKQAATSSDGRGRGNGAGKGDDARKRPERTARPESTRKEEPVSEQRRDEMMPIEEQQAAVEEFLQGLTEHFGLEASTSTAMDDDIIIASVEGNELGLMIGPKGGTMHAIQELARSAVQRRSGGRSTSRLLVDVAGYRERRRAALREFAHRQAAQVRDEGVELALEPMSSADRKAVHDAILDFEGVRSISEGDEPRRCVVLLPESD